MTAFSISARLYRGINSRLALSLPQSRLCILWARQLCPLAFLAASATGGARKPNPSEGAEAATAASHRIAKVKAEIKPAKGGLPSSVTVQCQGTAPCHLPQGEGLAATAAHRVRRSANRRASYLLFRSAKKCGAKPALLLS